MPRFDLTPETHPLVLLPVRLCIGILIRFHPRVFLVLRNNHILFLKFQIYELITRNFA